MGVSDERGGLPIIARVLLAAGIVALGGWTVWLLAREFEAQETLVIAVAAVTAIVAVRMLTGSAEVGIDEGGIRYSHRLRRGYVAFSEIRDARIERSMFQAGSVLRLSTPHVTFRFPLSRDPSAGLFPAILSRLGRRESAPAPPAEIATLARGERSLETWLGEARAACDAGGNAYRAAPPGTEALDRAFRDETLDIDLRAAAAHVLISRDAGRTRTAFAIGPGTPPLVVIAAAMGAPDAIDPALVADAALYLTRADRAAFRAARSPRIRIAGPASNVRVAEAHEHQEHQEQEEHEERTNEDDAGKKAVSGR